MKYAQALFVAICTACSGSGEWVDAPQSCQSIATAGAAIRHAFHSSGKHIMTIEEGKALNSAESLNATMGLTFEMVVRSLPALEAEELRQQFDEAVVSAGQLACGNKGKTFTGEWECNQERQRVKCK